MNITLSIYLSLYVISVAYLLSSTEYLREKSHYFLGPAGWSLFIFLSSFVLMGVVFMVQDAYSWIWSGLSRVFRKGNR